MNTSCPLFPPIINIETIYSTITIAIYIFITYNMLTLFTVPIYLLPDLM